MGPSRPPGTAARAAVAALVCVGAAGTLWGLGLAADVVQPAGRTVVLPVAAPRAPAVDPRAADVPAVPATGVPAAELPAAGMPVAEIPVAVARDLDTAAVVPLAGPRPDAAGDPLARWAERVGALVGLAPGATAGYARVEVAMRERMPGCHLSWVTVAAIDRVLAPGGDLGAVVCGGRADTSTAAGWSSAVRSVAGGDPVAVERMFTLATTYAVATVTGDPISPAARTAIDLATAQVGLPYVWGGDGPGQGDAGFDCSGLTTAAYAAAGVTLPRTAHTQYLATPRVTELRPGDLVFYGNPGTRIHHVGLYVGNGQMLNAPTFGRPVQLAAVRWRGDDYAGAGRPG